MDSRATGAFVVVLYIIALVVLGQAHACACSGCCGNCLFQGECWFCSPNAACPPPGCISYGDGYRWKQYTQAGFKVCGAGNEICLDNQTFMCKWRYYYYAGELGCVDINYVTTYSDAYPSCEAGEG